MTRIDLIFPTGRDSEKALLIAGHKAGANSVRLQRALEGATEIKTEAGHARSISVLAIPLDVSRRMRELLSETHPCEIVIETKAASIARGGAEQNPL